MDTAVRSGGSDRAQHAGANGGLFASGNATNDAFTFEPLGGYQTLNSGGAAGRAELPGSTLMYANPVYNHLEQQGRANENPSARYTRLGHHSGRVALSEMSTSNTDGPDASGTTATEGRDGSYSSLSPHLFSPKLADHRGEGSHRVGSRRLRWVMVGTLLAVAVAVTALGLVANGSNGTTNTAAPAASESLPLAMRVDELEEMLAVFKKEKAGLCDALYGSKALAPSFAIVQEVRTSGARDWEAFIVNGTAYLAVANSYNDSTYNIKSRIYRHSASSGRFELVQKIDTSGAHDWEAFTVSGNTYLAVANYYDGNTYNIKSHIYRHSAISGQFELVQEIDTSGALDWEAFELGGVACLAVANYYDGSTHNIKSRVYHYSAVSNRFELMQEVATSGASDWDAFLLDGVTYLAVANSRGDGDNAYNIKSRIYRHSADSGRFEVVQEIDTSSARDWEAFTVDGMACLAVANYYDDSIYNQKSRIYRYSARSGLFELAQEVKTNGAADWAAFTVKGTSYLVVASLAVASEQQEQGGSDDGNINSHVYRYSATVDRFDLVQEVDTSGASDWEAFELNGATYLAVANYHDVESRIYRLDAPC